MQRVFHSKEDQKLANRWLLIVVAAYSMAALMVVLVASLSSVSRDTTREARMEPAGFAHLLSTRP
jgi:hypothetical protein